MAMKIDGNLSGYAAGMQNYSSNAARSMAGSSTVRSMTENNAQGIMGNKAARSMTENSAADSAKKTAAENTSKTAVSGRSKSTAEYVSELEKLVPSVKFSVGNGFQTAKRGKTLTVNPKLLEKMQNDPKQEQETKELIRGVESAMNLVDSICKASGSTVVYKHSYIDENGEYRSIAYYRNDRMINLSKKLREERREISEKLIESAKEKAAERKEQSEELLEKKKTEKSENGTEEKTEESAVHKAEQLINEKIAASEDGTIYLNDADIRTMIEAAREEEQEKTAEKEQVRVGKNLDLQA